MCGTSLSRLANKRGVEVSAAMLAMLAVGAAALVGAASLPDGAWLELTGCFLAFELTVGFYFPSIGALRSSHVDGASRGVVLHLARLPLNAIVIGVTLGRDAIGNVGALRRAHTI